MRCPVCGYSFPAGSPPDARCPSCNLGEQIRLPQSTAPWYSAPPDPEGLIPGARVRGVLGLGIAVMTVTCVTTVLAVLGLLSIAAAPSLTDLLDKFGVSRTSGPTAILLLAFASLFGVALASTVLTIVWLYRTRKNVDAFTDAWPRWKAGWTIGAWFVPVASVILVPLVIADVARNSFSDWRQRLALTTIWTWFAVQLIGGCAGGLADDNDPSTKSELYVLLPTIVAGSLLQLVFIYLITKSQHERIARAHVRHQLNVPVQAS